LTPSPLVALLVAVVIALVVPLALVVPAWFRGRARQRAGKPPGWSGPGWQLWHVWLAFALLIVAELLVVAVLRPDVLGSIVGAAPSPGVRFDPSSESIGRQILWTSVAVGAIVMVIVPFVPLRTLIAPTWGVPRAIGAGVLGFLILRFVTILLSPLLPELGSADHPQRELTESLQLLTAEETIWATVVVAALFAPLVEEILFRGVLLTGLARHLSFGWANLIQASLFAALHLSSTLFPLFVLMGLMGGEMVRRSGGLLAPYAMHALNNASAILALWWLAELSLFKGAA